MAIRGQLEVYFLGVPEITNYRKYPLFQNYTSGGVKTRFISYIKDKFIDSKRSISNSRLISLLEFVRSRKENKLSSLRGCVNQPTDKHTLLRGRCMRGVSVSNSASYVYIYTNKFSTKNKNKSPFLKFLLKNKTNFILFLKNKTLSFLVGFFNFLGNKLSYYSPLI